MGNERNSSSRDVFLVALQRDHTESGASVGPQALLAEQIDFRCGEEKRRCSADLMRMAIATGCVPCYAERHAGPVPCCYQVLSRLRCHSAGGFEYFGGQAELA